MTVCWVIWKGHQIYTVIQVVHSLLYIVAKCHFFSVVTWKDIIKYLQKCDRCTHFSEILYIYIYIYISEPERAIIAKYCLRLQGICFSVISFQSSDPWFYSWAKPDSYWSAQDRLNDGWVKLFQQLLWQVVSWWMKDSLLLGFCFLQLMWVSQFRSWEMMDPRNLYVSTAVTVLSMMLSGESAGGLSVLSSRLFRLHQTAF